MKKPTFLKTLALFAGLLFLASSGWGQYAGTGTFEKITTLEEIESGTYYVFYGINETYTGAMTNTISGGRLGNTSVPLSGTNVVNPPESVVWLVTGNATDGYTIYNEAAGVYAEISTNSTSGFSLNTISSHTYNVNLNGTKGFFFKSLSSTGGDRGVSIYQKDWRPYLATGANTLNLYKLGEETEDPLLFATPSSLTNLNYGQDNGPSVTQSFEVTGTNLDGSNVIVTAPANFEVATSEDGTYGGSLTLTAFDGTATDIWVRLAAGLSVGEYSGNVSISGGGVTDPANVVLSGKVVEAFDVPYTNAFGTDADRELAAFQGFVLSGTTAASGYTRVPNEAYIETPVIDFTGYDYLKVFFSTATYGGYSDQVLNLEISTDGGTNYNTLFTAQPTSTTYVNDEVVIDLSGTYNASNGKLRFKTTSTTQAHEIRFRDLSIEEYIPPTDPTLVVNPTNLSGFTYLEGGGPSATQSFGVTGTSLNGNNVTITAPDNFEVSLNETSGFGATVTLTAFDGTATIVWVRLASGLSVNTYSGNVLVAGGGAPEVNVAVSGEVTIPIPEGYLVDFEGTGETKIAYASGTVNLSGLDWDMTEALIGTDASDWKNGVRSARLRGYGTSSMTMLANKTTGVGVVSFLYRRYGTDAQGDWKVEYSTDGGTTWTQIGSSFSAPTTDVVQTFSEELNLEGNVRIRIKRATESGTANQRLNIDDIVLTDYSGGEPAQEPTAHVTGFSATANSHSTITVSWTDSDADFYLIKGSDAGFSLITDPDDGFPETDGSLVKNVAAGLETYQFTGLTPSTTYYFKIYPYNGTGSSINYKTDELVPETSALTPAEPGMPNAWINEIHYDNDGTDVDESIEVVIENASLYSLSDFRIDLYNGNGGSSYDDKTLDLFFLGETIGDFTFFSYTYPADGIQNGAPDGLALSYNGELIPGQFLSYEGSFTGSGGVADGVTSEDIVVQESSSTPVGYSLQLTGFGSKYEDFTWLPAGLNTTGAINTGQSFLSTTWEGTVDNDWEKTENWDNGMPAPHMLAIIPDIGAEENDPIISATFSIANLTIETEGLLTIQSELTVEGALENLAGTAGLLIKDGGSLIHNTPGVEATMERNFPTGESWRLVSSPVAAQSISDDWIPTGTYGDGTGYDFYAWDELTQYWLNQKVTENNITTFNPGQGYLISFELDNQTKSFAGNLNVGDVDVTVGYDSNNEAYSSSNLIGNPYPSGIDWNLADRTLFADNFAYVYDRVSTIDGVTEGYNYVDGGTTGAYIAANQGFFVLKAETGNGTFTFTNAMRAHGGTFTKSNPESEALVMRLDKDSYYDVTTIRVREETEFTRDRSDALKFFSYSSEVPQLFTQSADNMSLAINSVPQLNEDTEFALGLRAPASGQYTLSVSELSGVFQSNELFIRDLQTGAVQNLKQSPEFSFQANAGDDPARFIITFAQPTGITDVEEGLGSIHTWNRTLYLNFAEEAEGRLLQVFDLSGRLVMSDGLDHGLNHTRQMNLEAGVYLVRVSSPGGVATQRVFVK